MEEKLATLNVYQPGLSTSYIMFAACHLIYSTAMPISWMCHASITTEFFSPGLVLICRKIAANIAVSGVSL